MATLPPSASPSQQPVSLEEEDAILDMYDLYSLAHPYLAGGGRKGRTKREAAANTNRPSPGGHERKLLTKFQNSEKKKPGAETELEMRSDHGHQTQQWKQDTALSNGDSTMEKLGPGPGSGPACPLPRSQDSPRLTEAPRGGTEEAPPDPAKGLVGSKKQACRGRDRTGPQKDTQEKPDVRWQPQ